MSNITLYTPPVKRLIDQAIQMNNVQLSIVKAQNNMPVRFGQSGQTLSIELGKASMKIGTNLTDEGKRLLIEFIVLQYPNITPDEIRVAFDLLCTGELNEYLQDDRGKIPEHYGQLSALYLGKVLAAYIDYARLQLAPLYLKLKPHDTERELTKTEKADLDRIAKLEFAEDIRHRGISALHRTHFNTFFYNWFEMANLVPPLTEPNEDEINQGVRTLRSTGRIDVYEMMSGKAEGKVLSEHQRNQIVQNLNELFLKEESGVIADRLINQ